MNKNINAYVADEKTNTIGDEYIEPEKIPQGSIERFHRRVWKHILRRDREGNIQLPDIDYNPHSGELPGDLYDALVDRHSPNVFCNKEHPGKKWGIVALYVIIGALFLFLFIVWAVNLGPK